MRFGRFNLYDVLHVAPSASAAEIKAAFRILALKHHPDRNNDSPESTARFKTIYNAYSVLSDPVTRGEYDSHLHAETRSPVPATPTKGGGPAPVSLISSDPAETVRLVLDHLNFMLWDIEELLGPARRDRTRVAGFSVQDYLLMMLTFIDKWVLNAAGFPDYFFEARRIRAAATPGGIAAVPSHNLRSGHQPYANVEDYFYDIRKRADRFLNSAKLSTLLTPLPGTSVRIIDCVFEAHNYCVHYLGWLDRARREDSTNIPPFRHSDPLFEAGR